MFWCLMTPTTSSQLVFFSVVIVSADGCSLSQFCCVLSSIQCHLGQFRHIAELLSISACWLCWGSSHQLHGIRSDFRTLLSCKILSHHHVMTRCKFNVQVDGDNFAIDSYGRHSLWRGYTFVGIVSSRHHQEFNRALVSAFQQINFRKITLN